MKSSVNDVMKQQLGSDACWPGERRRDEGGPMDSTLSAGAEGSGDIETTKTPRTTDQPINSTTPPAGPLDLLSSKMGQSAGRVSAPATPEPQPEQAQSHSAHPKMQANLPGPRETIVSSVHGNTARSDNASPVAVQHHAQGAVITPPPSRPPGPKPRATAATSSAAAAYVGKVHFALPTLRAPEQETPRGTLAGRAMVSTSLEIQAAPYAFPSTSADGADASAPGRGKGQGQGQADITAVELYAGREPLGA
ncbi:hypothetical protein DL770_003535 [Monosporascus sp. CRB-9-2]|nr:hypothetical protein DL770_003535 [Monosporascus sp. CRB-9-2]